MFGQEYDSLLILFSDGTTLLDSPSNIDRKQISYADLVVGINKYSCNIIKFRHSRITSN